MPTIALLVFPFPSSLALADLDGVNGFCINGKGLSDYSASGTGRRNGDAVDDLVISAPNDNEMNYVALGRRSILEDTTKALDSSHTNDPDEKGAGWSHDATWLVRNPDDVLPKLHLAVDSYSDDWLAARTTCRSSRVPAPSTKSASSERFENFLLWRVDRMGAGAVIIN